jgi:hypothetical protein
MDPAAGWGAQMSREQHLAAAFVELVDTPVDDYDVVDLLDRLADRGGLDVDQAFNLLRGYARNHNLRLSDTARRVVEDTDFAQAVLHPRGA